MTDKYEAPLLEHEADGIKELDNKLPRWWVWLFYLAIVFGICYVNYYHITGKGKSTKELYQQEMAAARKVQDDAVAAAPPRDLKPSDDPAVLAQGQSVFQANCVACHTADGGGLIGPNMTDDHFIHGPNFSDMVAVIEQGVLAKGMVAWKPLLKPDDLMAVASYAWSLQGTTPANPKAPEGHLASAFDGVDRRPGQTLASLTEPEPTEPPVASPDAGAPPAAMADAASEPSLDEATLAKGKDVYTKNCVVCHTADGGGLVGPNFTDDYFIHGPTFADSVRIINVGVPAKGMISWKPMLKPSEIHAVASYVWTLRGTTPANPKAPEGTQHK